MDDEKKLKIITKDGEEKEYRIVCAFKLPITNKNYVIYTDDKMNDNDETEVYAAIYYPDDDTKLDEVKSKEEWDAIETVINALQEGDEL